MPSDAMCAHTSPVHRTSPSEWFARNLECFVSFVPSNQSPLHPDSRLTIKSIVHPWILSSVFSASGLVYIHGLPELAGLACS